MRLRRKRQVAVGRVLPEREALGREPGAEVRPGETEERPDDRARLPGGDRGDAGQSQEPRPAHQAHEDGLGLIGHGVAGGDLGRTRRCGGPAQETVAQVASGLLEVELLPRRRATGRRPNPTSSGRTQRRASSSTKRASSPDSSRSRWLKWASRISRGISSRSFRRRAARATESGPPDTAARTRSPGTIMPPRAVRLNVRKTRSWVFGAGMVALRSWARDPEKMAAEGFEPPTLRI